MYSRGAFRFEDTEAVCKWGKVEKGKFLKEKDHHERTVEPCSTADRSGYTFPVKRRFSHLRRFTPVLRFSPVKTVGRAGHAHDS